MSLITLTLTSRTTRYETWLIAHHNTLHSVRTERNQNRRSIDNLRYVICRTLKLNSAQFRFIGNRRINGQWITEWIEL
jgi:hypothetical protein